ncbi:MAG TPA: hypothetical protein VKF17_16665 [Isosphaeraceae bacterium]|nr:hypothetical protein [Isosphaeraceae bacterium]
MTRDEARKKAAEHVLDALICCEGHGEDWEFDPQVQSELQLIEQWLRARVCGGDKVLIRQLEKPLGRQVKPPRGQVRAIERLAKRAGKPPGPR